MRLVLCLSLGLAVAAAGCGPRGAALSVPLSDRQWRDLTEGRLPPGVLPMSLTVIDAEGRQSVAFECDLRGQSPSPFVPLSCERRTTVAGVEGRSTESEGRYAPLMAEVRYRASGGNGRDKLRLEGIVFVARWLPPGTDQSAKSAGETWPGEFRNVRLAGGVLHGELALDKAAVVADLRDSFAAREMKYPGLKLEARAVLLIRLDNAQLRDALPKKSDCVLTSAWGLVPDWERWSIPEKTVPGGAR